MEINTQKKNKSWQYEYDIMEIEMVETEWESVIQCFFIKSYGSLCYYLNLMFVCMTSILQL
jgi:hypothetical protein